MSFSDQFGGNSTFGFSGASSPSSSSGTSSLFNLGADKYNFSETNSSFDFGSSGTLRKQRNKGRGGADAAKIINSSAGALDSITGLVGMFTGKTNQDNNQNNNYTPPPKKPISPLVIGGVVIGVIVLIALLMKSKNGQPNTAQ